MRILSVVAAYFALVSVGQAATVSNLFDSVRKAIHSARSDADVATLIAETKLSERLESAVIEELETEGAGTETIQALEVQQELTSTLRLPAEPVRLFDAPPAPGAEAEASTITKARGIALNYTSTLPNFLCKQTVTRFSGKTGDWKADDTLLMSVAYTAKGERYKLEKVDGKPAKKTLAQIGGFRSSGEFGSLLKSIFRPEAQTTFRWQRWTNLHGHLVHVYSFHIEQNRSNYKVGWKTLFRNYDMYTALGGSVFIDAETNTVLRIISDAEGVPSDWPIRGSRGLLEYGNFEIGGQKYLLPIRTEQRVWVRAGQRRNVTTFSDYKKFSGESKISFETDSPEK